MKVSHIIKIPILHYSTYDAKNTKPQKTYLISISCRNSETFNYESHYTQLRLLLFIFSWLRPPHAGLFFFDVVHDDFIIVTVQ